VKRPNKETAKHKRKAVQ